MNKQKKIHIQKDKKSKKMGIKNVKKLVGAIIVIVGFIAAIITIITHLPTETKLSDEQLKEEVMDFSKNLIIFAQDRIYGTPEYDFENRELSDYISSEYSKETKRLYFEEYWEDALSYYDEFKKRNIIDAQLKDFINSPTNSLVIKEIGIRFGELANQI